MFVCYMCLSVYMSQTQLTTTTTTPYNTTNTHNINTHTYTHTQVLGAVSHILHSALLANRVAVRQNVPVLAEGGEKAASSHMYVGRISMCVCVFMCLSYSICLMYSSIWYWNKLIDATDVTGAMLSVRDDTYDRLPCLSCSKHTLPHSLPLSLSH